MFQTVVSYIPVVRNYFPTKSGHVNEKKTPSIIKQADVLFENKRYDNVYELLQPYKYSSNAEILWRLHRVLFKFYKKSPTKERKQEIINEAYELIQNSATGNNAALHKWMAIILDTKYGCDGIYSKINNAHVVKNHLLYSLSLDPNDYSVLYMLGWWSYSMSRLSWFQRKVISFLYTSPPRATYEEAYEYFAKAEELKPRFYLPNVFMLGKVSYHMNQHYRAKYYLNIASALSPKNEYEKRLCIEAKLLEMELEMYDLAKSALISDFAS